LVFLALSSVLARSFHSPASLLEFRGDFCWNRIPVSWNWENEWTDLALEVSFRTYTGYCAEQYQSAWTGKIMWHAGFSPEQSSSRHAAQIDGWIPSFRDSLFVPFWPLNIRPICCAQTSVISYHLAPP